MPKTLSNDPAKRRFQLFQNIYLHYYHWRAALEDHQITEIQMEGETVYFYDLLVGLDDLPPRQRQAFELHILRGLTEVEAHRLMEFKSEYTTLVGQYSTDAIKSMIRAYDAATLDCSLHSH